MTVSTLLSNAELFADLDLATIQGLTSHTREHTLRRGDVIFGEGDEPGELFLVAGRDRLGCRRCCGLAYASQLTRERGRAKPSGRVK